jgi:hypothetical protein
MCDIDHAKGMDVIFGNSAGVLDAGFTTKLEDFEPEPW